MQELDGFTVKNSVVVAVYNVEKWINRCLNSLCSQSLQEFEVILVDDGSCDSSSKICDEFVKDDVRFIAIHKDNYGVASARQCGIDNAIGEYIIHIDPDDWVEANMLERLYSKAIKDDSDMVICDFMKDYVDGSRKYIVTKPSDLNHEVVLKEFFKHFDVFCWNKLVRRSIIKKFDIQFQLGMSFGEDEIFNARLLQNNIRIAYLPMGFVHYCLGQHDSLSSNIKKEDYYKKQKIKIQYLRHYIKEEYHEYYLVDEVIYAMLALDCRGEEIASFSESFSWLRERYLKYNNKIVIMYLFLAFHGFAKSVGIIHHFVKCISKKVDKFKW